MVCIVFLCQKLVKNAFYLQISGYGVDTFHSKEPILKKKQIWLPVFKCEKYWILCNLNAISWIIYHPIKVSMYCSYIWQTAGLFLSDFSQGFLVQGCQLNWILFGWRGCGRLAVVRPPMVLSSWCFVWLFPRGPSMKIWWCLGGWLLIVACKDFKSQRYESKNRQKWWKFGPPRWIGV